MKRASLAGFLVACLAPSFACAQPCHFDAAALSFDGAPAEQARCLLRPVARWGKLGAKLATLPPTLARLLGTKPAALGEKLAVAAVAGGLPGDILQRPLSRAKGGDASAPYARYFVIHDTSSPWFGDKPFPPSIDTDPHFANLDAFLGPKAVAHAFIGRTGIIRMSHDFSVPWRATKRERAIGIDAKGLFLHIENIQPRRRDPSGGPKNDAIAPVPGLTNAQYDSLALMYVIASVRGGSWLIPAYHAALDEGISDGHDDPQNFDLAAFDEALKALLERLRG